MKEPIQNNNTQMQFLENFLSGYKADQDISEAKQNDKIEKLTASIEKTRNRQNKNLETIKVCKTVIESHSYPSLGFLISYISDNAERSAKKNDNKIKKLKKKLRKAKRKIKKIQRNKGKLNLLNNFFNVLKYPKSGSSEYITAVQALKEDSVIRTENQLKKIKSQIAKDVLEMNNSNISYGQSIKLGKRIQKLKSKRDKLMDRLTSLNELDSELTKLAKMELADDKIDEIKNTSAETADKSAMKGSTVTDIIDNQTETSTETIQQVIEPESKKEQKKEESTKQEQTAKTTEKPKIQAVTLRNLKPEEAAKMLSAGIEFSVVRRNDGSFSAVFNRADAEKVRKALSEKQTQSQNMKR